MDKEQTVAFQRAYRLRNPHEQGAPKSEVFPSFTLHICRKLRDQKVFPTSKLLTVRNSEERGAI